MRFAVVRTADDVHRLIVTSHHIAIDGWSGPIVIADLLAAYGRGATITAQEHRGSSSSCAGWATPTLPPGWPGGASTWPRSRGPTLIAPAMPSGSAEALRDHVTALSAELTAGLQALARDRGVTVATIIQTAWAIFLARMTGQRSVAFGETVSGRPADLDGADQMVGLFINTVPVVITVDDHATIAQLLDTVQQDKTAAGPPPHRSGRHLTKPGTAPSSTPDHL